MEPRERGGSRGESHMPEGTAVYKITVKEVAEDNESRYSLILSPLCYAVSTYFDGLTLRSGKYRQPFDYNHLSL